MKWQKKNKFWQKFLLYWKSLLSSWSEDVSFWITTLTLTSSSAIFVILVSHDTLWFNLTKFFASKQIGRVLFLRNIQTSCSLFFQLNESNLRRLSSLKIPIAQKGRLRPISKRGVPKRGLKTAHGVMVCAPYLEKKTRTLLSSTSFGPFLVYNLYPVLAYKDLLLNVFYNT